MNRSRQNRMILSMPMNVGDLIRIFFNSLSSITGSPIWTSLLNLRQCCGSIHIPKFTPVWM